MKEVAQREARRQQRQEYSRQGILAAAKRVFARNGIESATMQEIAQEAGYSPSSLYNYFPSKEDILGAALEEISAAALEAASRAQAEGETYREYFESLMVDQLQLAERNREFFSFFVHTRQTPNQRACVSPEHVEREVDRLREILESGMRQGVIRQMDSTVAAHFVHAAAHALFFLKFTGSRSESPEALAREFCDFVFDGLEVRG